jgi:Tol biopolymer transport system component
MNHARRVNLPAQRPPRSGVGRTHTDEAGISMPMALAVVAMTMTIALLAAPAIRHWRETAPPPPASVRAAWLAPPGLEVGAGADYPFGLAIAPDGRRVVFPARRDGTISLWLQDLRTGQVDSLPGTDTAVMPFWSPDGARIGFFVPGAIKVFELADASVSELGPAESARGAAWNSSGDLVFAASPDLGLQIRRADGSVQALTTVDASAGESSHALPTFLDDDRHVVFFVQAESPMRQGAWLTSIDTPEDRVRLVGTDAQPLYANGRIIYASDTAIVSQRLDLENRRLAGEVAVLGVGVGRGPAGQLLAAAAGDALIFAPPSSTLRELTWFNRDGARESVMSTGVFGAVRIAPDGRRVAVTELQPQLRTLDVVIFEPPNPVPIRLSRSTDADDSPAWSPDGLRVAWVSGRRKILVRGAGAVLEEETVAVFDEPVRVSGWTPDGSAIIFSRRLAGTRDDIWMVPVRPGGEPRSIVATPFADVQGTVSPDGRWIAYASDESGEFEIYVERFVERFADRSPEPATRIRVTSGGGSDPRWRRDGRELFFRRGGGIHAAVLAAGRGQIEIRSTSMVVETDEVPDWFDAAPTGRRFLLNLHQSGQAPAPATLLLHY